MKIRFLYLAAIMLALPGCIAQTFLGDEDQSKFDLPEEFPNLHDVPGRPAPEDMNMVQLDFELADESNQSNLEYNQELREKLGLQVGEGE